MHKRVVHINIVPKSADMNLEFWLSKTPEERIEAVEFLRMQSYALMGYEKIPRFIPVIQIRETNK